MEIHDVPSADRLLIATWAIKTARTEEWTGQQVMRLLPTIDDVDAVSGERALVIVQHAKDEFRHAELYATFARAMAANTGPQAPGQWVQGADQKWLVDYTERHRNFRESGFTSIFRVMDEVPLCGPIADGLYAGRDDDVFYSGHIRFYTALFFLDLAGLMTVNVYDESPFRELQAIALKVREDESRHVALGRDYLMDVAPGRRHLVQEAVTTLLPHIKQFFGGDESHTQKALARHGIRGVSNSELWTQFKHKVGALLRVEVEEMQ